jgi:SAM-dependent methyltransferase
MDADPQSFTRCKEDNVLRMTGNLILLPFENNSFDRITCISVLEHIESPFRALCEFRRVLKPGGRLLVSFDVANYHRWNHTIDIGCAQSIVEYFGLTMVPPPPEASVVEFPEIERKPHDPEKVALRCLCFFWDKPI